MIKRRQRVVRTWLPVEVMAVVVTVAAPVLGGATQLWAQAVVALGCGLLLLWAPPRTGLPGPLGLAFAGLLGLAFVSFLPYGWLASFPWRDSLTTNLRLTLPSTLTAQPWVSLESALLLCVGLAWAGWLLTCAWQTPRSLLLTYYCAALTAVTAVDLLFHFANWPMALWKPVNGVFGFFPNRNQTGNLLGIGGVLALALAFQALKHRRRSALGWGLSYVLLLVALVVNYSRAGLLIFFVGSLIWLVWTSWQAPASGRPVLGVTVLLILLAGFFLFGGRTLDRLLQPLNEKTSVTADFRIKIHADALRLYRDASWHGIGLGNFSAVFARYRVASAAENRALHPESDWLWAGIELGWFSPLLVWLAVGYVLYRRWPSPTDSSFLWLAAVVVGTVLFVLHGFVDVSGHRMGTVWPALFLLSLLKPRRLDPGWTSRGAGGWGYRALGLLLAAVAGWWLASVFRPPSWPTSAHLARVLSDIERAGKRQAYDYVVSRATQGLRYAPLEWLLYFHRAKAGLLASLSLEGVVADFGRARFLEPNLTRMAQEEGLLWLQREPRLALGPWLETLRRTTGNRAEVYRNMLSAADSVPEIRNELFALSYGSPELLLVFLSQATPQEVAIEVDKLLLADPALKSLTTDQKKALFLLWAQRGNARLLEEKLQVNPTWLVAGWPACAGILANHRQFQQACELVNRFAIGPALPSVQLQKPVDEMKRALLIRTNDLVTGFALYQAQWQAQDLEGARATLRHLVGVPKCPPYFFYLQAQLEMKQADWETAWQAWKQFLAGSGWPLD